MERHEAEAVVKKKHTILKRATLFQKGVKIPNLECFMWTKTKQNYDKHVERMENQKDIIEEENKASKTMFVPLFMMEWEVPMLDVML